MAEGQEEGRGKNPTFQQTKDHINAFDFGRNFCLPYDRSQRKLN